MDDAEEVLPYRTDAGELLRWTEARARGRSPEQMRDEEFSVKTLEGTTVAAAAFGLVDRVTGALTERGEGLALAGPRERARLLRGAVLDYAPYRRVLEAVRERGEWTSDARWIETWWATHGIGSSPSNRSEGVAAFGRLVDFLGLGRYVPGRRGHPTRVEWEEAEVERALAEPGEGEVRTGREDAPERAPAAGPAPERRGGGGHEVNHIVVPLSTGGTAELRVPLRLPREEKRRLISLLELLITDA